MKSSNKCLFGGALLCAGMMTAVADAQQFQIGYTAAHAYGFAYPNFNSAYQYGTGPFSISAPAFGNYGDYANAVMDFGSLGLSGLVTASAASNYTFAHSHNFYGEFTVDQDFTANVNWDFSQAGNFFTNYLVINDVNSGTVFSAYSFSSGSQQLSLSAQTQYQIYGLVDVGLDPEGTATSSWNVTVPAPGSAALLGVAGLAAARRRRTLTPNR